MERHDRTGETRTDPQPEKEKRDPRERTAPPIEREHETREGVFEEDEQRKRGRE